MIRMKIKTISAEIKLSKNYQTYLVGMSAELEEGDNEMTETKILQAKCRKLVKEQIELDKI